MVDDGWWMMVTMIGDANAVSGIDTWQQYVLLIGDINMSSWQTALTHGMMNSRVCIVGH